MRTMRAWTTMALVLVGGCTTVEAGHVGIAKKFGKVEGYTFTEGFHWKDPLVSVVEMSYQTQLIDLTGDRRVQVLSKDQLPIVVEASVQYHLNEGQAPGVYRFFGEDYDRRVVYPAVRSAIRDGVAGFEAVELVRSREALAANIRRLLRKEVAQLLEQRGIPSYSVAIDGMLLRNVQLPPSIQESIASVQRQRARSAEREQAINTSRQEAEKLRIEAEGRARALQIQAEAEAEANRTISESLSPEVLKIRAIEASERVLTSDGNRVILLPSSGQSPLLLNIGE
ncbi:MAG TPA: prohibitin family protein [Polyangiaceae bacterium LLY-WYZ-14_1]|nr:prohibitin family protein [Polyangiaceae bacterium LLY-WYZ-14_1]